MKHRTWFRLALKAIGVLLIGYSISVVFHLAALLYELVVHGEAWLPGIHYAFGEVTIIEEIIWGALYMLQMLSPLLIGLYLVLGGKWLVNVAIPLDRPYCDKCGLDLSDATGTRCPECGSAIARTDSDAGSGAAA